MANVIITADSTCDLSREQRERYGVIISPLYVRVGEDERRDGIDIDAQELFRQVESSGTLPKTAACSVDDYLALWRPYAEAGKEIVHINLSSAMSSCHQNACLAAQELKGVYVIDSLNLSTGSGLLAVEASILAEQGKTGQEIYDILLEKRERLNVSFVLDTMEYLAKGGRCSSVAAFAAGVLRLRLCIEVKNGKMDVCKKYRGKMNAVLRQYVHERLQAAGEVETERIFITHTGNDAETVEELKQAILEEKPFAEILESNAGCTVSAHCGPKCLGILFFVK